MNKKTIWWVLLGLGSRLQVVSSLSFSEAVILVVSPFIFLDDYRHMQNDGILPFFYLSVAVIIGCGVASFANGTNFSFVLRGFAATTIVSCAIVFTHWLMRKDPSGLGWYLLFAAISYLLSTFIFQQAAEINMYGATVEDIVNSPTFWTKRIGAFADAPIRGWYLHIPIVVSVGMPIGVAALAVLTSVSGRGVALGQLAFCVLVLIGGKTRQGMNRISRHFGMMCLFALVFGGLVYGAYRYVASNGYLGEQARKKYERQAQGGGLGRLILGGRAESFIGLLACVDKPIVGWGPWAIDKNGYAEQFINTYGTLEDVVEHRKIEAFRRKYGFADDQLLACHSCITEYWSWYGISGLLFWLYVIYVFLRYLKQDVAAVPQWYAWLACSIPGLMWTIVFNPFASRIGLPMMVVGCLMARAVRVGRFCLPMGMVEECYQAERS